MPSPHVHRANSRRRGGIALLEAIVALTILTFAGTWAVVMVRQASYALIQARMVDVDTRRASAFLDAVALWPRQDLYQHLGARREGPWILLVDRLTPTLYEIALTTVPDGARGRESSMRELLRTTLYRPEGAP